MDNRRIPALIGLTGVIIAVALFFLLKDDTADQATERTTTVDKPKPDPEPEVATIEVKAGEPVGGVQELEFTEGEQIRIEVTSDSAAEVHFHGYDVIMDIEPGKPAEFNVDATIGGRFELELEETAVLLAEISVVPS